MGKVLEHYKPMMTYAFGNGHIGIDIVGNLNGTGALDGIVALEKGTIEAIESNCAKVYNNVNDAIRDWGHSYGCYVLLNHGTINGHTYKTRYAHLQYRSNSLLKVGQVIQKGQGIGEMGATGNTNGGHLHFEVIRDGKVIDPYSLIFDGKELSDLDKPKVIPPTSVNRDEYIDQFEVLYSDVNVRSGAGTNYEVVYYPCTKGIYNVLEVNGDWYKIKDGMWINKIAGVYLPKLDLKEEEQPNILPSEETTEIEPIIEEIEVHNRDKENVLIWLIEIIVKFINKIFKKN